MDDNSSIYRPSSIVHRHRGGLMIAGHFGLAAIVKGREPQVPLWALMLSTQLLDVFFVVLFLLNIQSFTPIPGTGGRYRNMIIHADYTHSLVGALVISIVAMIAAWIPWGRRNGLIIGAVVFSHWILDLIVHRGDMPILPGNAGDLPTLGFGLWRVPAVSIPLEAILLLIGVFLYWRAARSLPSQRIGRVTPSLVAGVMLVSGAIVLVLD